VCTRHANNISLELLTVVGTVAARREAVDTHPAEAVDIRPAEAGRTVELAAAILQLVGATARRRPADSLVLDIRSWRCVVVITVDSSYEIDVDWI
jgi:hypothetical protein